MAGKKVHSYKNPLAVALGGTGCTNLEDFAKLLNIVSSGLPIGTTDGDFIRWDSTTSSWEVNSEPIELKQIILTPSEEPETGQEGSVIYKGIDKSVYICTSAI